MRLCLIATGHRRESYRGRYPPGCEVEDHRRLTGEGYPRNIGPKSRANTSSSRVARISAVDGPFILLLIFRSVPLVSSICPISCTACVRRLSSQATLARDANLLPMSRTSDSVLSITRSTCVPSIAMFLPISCRLVSSRSRQKEL